MPPLLNHIATSDRILVVDDDEGLLTLLKMRLSSLGYEVTTCQNGHSALAGATEAAFDFAILDVRLPDMDGIQLMEQLLQQYPTLPILILTAHGCIPDAVEAMKKGAYSYLTKPFDDKELHASVEKALSQKRMSQEIMRLNQYRL